MQNKHKLWILIALIILLAAGAYSFTQGSTTPNLTLINPNSTENNSQQSNDTSGSIDTTDSDEGGDTSSGDGNSPKKVVQAKACTFCKGTGKVTCPTCNGAKVIYSCSVCGKRDFYHLGGPCRLTAGCSGWIQERQCYSCNGLGYLKCYACGGDGKINPGDPNTEGGSIL